MNIEQSGDFKEMNKEDKNMKLIYTGRIEEHNVGIYQSNFESGKFNVVDDTAIGQSKKTVKQHGGNSLAVVMYLDKRYYAETNLTQEQQKEHNNGVHFPYMGEEKKSLYTSLLANFFEETFQIITSQITIGHEHGKLNGKCHLQICVDFSTPFRKILYPTVIEFQNKDDFPYPLLMMAQVARSSKALQQYCMKDHDFWYLHPEKALKIVRYVDKKGNEGGVNPYATIAANMDNLTSEQANEILFKHDPKTAFTMYKNLEYAFSAELGSGLPEFDWCFPEHLLGKYPLIEKWFNTWCKPFGLLRRKALLLYSEDRCMGKTEFARRLVNAPNYVVVFRNTFTDTLKNKVPKLLILDDMAFYTQQNKETWKALVAGQTTSIRDCFLNVNWSYEVPCIITTNNLFLVKQLFTSPEFKTQIMFQEIYSYMGPEGTQPQDMDQVEFSFSSHVQNRIDEMIMQGLMKKNQ